MPDPGAARGARTHAGTRRLRVPAADKSRARRPAPRVTGIARALLVSRAAEGNGCTLEMKSASEQGQIRDGNGQPQDIFNTRLKRSLRPVLMVRIANLRSF